MSMPVLTQHQHDMLMNLAEGAGAWKHRSFTPFVRLEKKGLAEYVPAAPPRWRVTDAGWNIVKELMGRSERSV